MRLAELQPVGMICEIMDDRGEMLRVPELLEFARRFGYNVINITSLTNHRRKRERN